MKHKFQIAAIWFNCFILVRPLHQFGEPGMHHDTAA
jgi:hypothetical protein